MTELEEAAIRQALEFVEYHSKYWNGNGAHPQEIATAMRQALEQPAAQFAGSYGTIDESAARRIATALGWKPPFSWVGLTQQDIDIAFDDTQEGGGFNEFARAIEKTLRRKNNG